MFTSWVSTGLGYTGQPTQKPTFPIKTIGSDKLMVQGLLSLLKSSNNKYPSQKIVRVLILATFSQFSPESES